MKMMGDIRFSDDFLSVDDVLGEKELDKINVPFTSSEPYQNFEPIDKKVTPEMLGIGVAALVLFFIT